MGLKSDDSVLARSLEYETQFAKLLEENQAYLKKKKIIIFWVKFRLCF